MSTGFLGSLQLDIVVCDKRIARLNIARQPHRLFDLALSRILPDQQIRDSARIVKIGSHNPRRDDGHVLPVKPCPKTEEMAVPSARLFFSAGRRLAEPLSRRRHQPLALTEGDIDDLAAFLASLTSADYKEQGVKELARQRDTARAFGPKPPPPKPPRP